MKPSQLLTTILLLGATTSLSAQKVIRKGVTPVQKKQASPKAVYGIGQLTGKWQETTRRNRTTNESLPFQDSLLLNFKGNHVEVRDGAGMNMHIRGIATIAYPNSLDVAGDVYSILSLNKTTLVIDDGEFIRTLNKTDRFYYESLGKIQVKTETFNQPVIVNLSTLQGKWVVYRRQAEPGGITGERALIKSITILQDSAGNYATGNITFYQKGITQSLPMTITFTDGKMQILSGGITWNLYTYKADGKEFIFGKTGELLYYAKRL